MTFLSLIASSNDFLVEASVKEAVAAASQALGGAEVERLPDDITPEDLAMELQSPSLFAPTRVLVVAEVRRWLGAPAPAGALADSRAVDPEALVDAISGGVPEGTALVMGAWCRRQPTKSALVKTVKDVGEYQWIPLPDPPKPWEDVVLSADQKRVLGGLLRKEAGETRFEPEAEELLLDRLGFDPRRLVSEARKLVAAAGEGGVDVALVRRLVLPRERSLEVVRDAVLRRQPTPILDLVDAAVSGAAVHDWQGRPVSPDRIGGVLCGQVGNLMVQLLDLRRTAAAAGLDHQLDPGKTRDGRWYQRVFKSDIAPVISDQLSSGGPTPLQTKKGGLPSPWSLGQLFRGASLYTDRELEDALVSCGEVETAQRGTLKLEALSAWIVSTLGCEP